MRAGTDKGLEWEGDGAEGNGFSCSRVRHFGTYLVSRLMCQLWHIYRQIANCGEMAPDNEQTGWYTSTV